MFQLGVGAEICPEPEPKFVRSRSQKSKKLPAPETLLVCVGGGGFKG